jgi:hypothetical protein
MVVVDIVPCFHLCVSLAGTEIEIISDLNRSQPPLFIMVRLSRDVNLEFS